MWWLGHCVVGALCGGWVIVWWVHYVVVGSFCGGCTMWWLGHCVVGYSVVGARCGGYAVVVNVPNRAHTICVFDEKRATKPKFVDPRSTFRNNFFQPARNVFVARQVDHAR